MLLNSFLISNPVFAIFSFFVLVSLMTLILFLYLKEHRFELILIVFLFSLIIGVTSIADFNLPFSPYFQLFFLLFQTIVFYLVIEEKYVK